MDIIFIALMQLLFLGGFIGFLVWLSMKLDAKKKADEKFAASANAQLDFVYKKSPYYEPAHMRYPVFRLE